MRALNLVAILGSVLAVPASAYAQASIVGVVRDSSGAVLPGVTVEASSPTPIEKSRSGDVRPGMRQRRRGRMHLSGTGLLRGPRSGRGPGASSEPLQTSVPCRERHGCFNLAIAFEAGRGVTADLTQARTWYVQACRGGVERACGAAERLK